MSAARDAGVERDPTGVPPHHLDDDDASVRGRGREQAIDALGGEVDGGVEPERRLGVFEIVVDRLRHADDAEAALVEVVADREGAVAADRDQGVDLVLAELCDQFLGTVDLDERTVGLLDRVAGWIAAVGGAEDRAAGVDDAAHIFAGELDDAVAARVLLRSHQAVEAVTDADDVPAPVAGGERGGADDGVQTRSIAAAGAQGDALDGECHGPDASSPGDTA